MTPNVRQWLALLTAASFAASGIGAYVHLALHPHHYCPEHHRFEAGPEPQGHGDGGHAHDPSCTSHAAPDQSDQQPVDPHHSCPAMAFATTPAEMAQGPVPTPAPIQAEATAPPIASRTLLAPIAAIRLAPKASPPA